MKKIKTGRFDIVKALDADDDIGVIVEGLVKQMGRDAVIAAARDAFQDPDRWSSAETPAALADTLVQLGEIGAVVDALVESAELFEEALHEAFADFEQRASRAEKAGKNVDELEPPDLDMDDDVVVEACVLALTDGGPAALEAVHQALADDRVAAARSPLIEVLAGLGENGLRDERSWPLIAALFDDDSEVEGPGVACAFAAAYGDPRAVPLIQAVLDRTAPSAEGPDSDENAIIEEAVAALEGFDDGAVRDADRAKLAEVERLNTSWEIQRSGQE